MQQEKGVGGREGRDNFALKYEFVKYLTHYLVQQEKGVGGREGRKSFALQKSMLYTIEHIIWISFI